MRRLTVTDSELAVVADALREAIAAELLYRSRRGRDRLRPHPADFTAVGLWHRQLLVYHFMFGPGYTAGCPACSAIADGFDRSHVHLATHDVTLMAISLAPIAAISAYKRRMGWTSPWASSEGSDFNYDFHTSLTEEQQRSGSVEYNFRQLDTTRLRTATVESGPATMAAMTATDVATYTRQAPGMSAFALDDGVVYHTYSAYARGLDGLWAMYQWLDRAPLGRNETGLWFRRRDEY